MVYFFATFKPGTHTGTDSDYLERFVSYLYRRPEDIKAEPSLIRQVEIQADCLFSEPRPGAGFSIWSDGLVRRFALPEPITTISLSQEAKLFIREYGTRPSWLWKVRDVTAKEIVWQLRGQDAGLPPTITKYTLELVGGESKAVWVYEVGLLEDAIFKVFDTLAQARKAAKVPDYPPDGPTECLECGSRYPAPGHVDAAQMECEKCG